MQKKALGLLLCCLLALLPVCGLASDTQPALPLGCPMTENIIRVVSVPGTRTSGITFIVHDVYFDGLQLQVSVTQVANDLHMSVFEEDVYEMDPAQNAFVLGKNLDFDNGQIGAYCQVTACDEDQRDMYNSGGESGPNGRALVQTDYFNFTPQRIQNTVHVEISCGVIEKVMREDETPEWESIGLDIPVQNPVAIQTIPITKNESPLPIQEVLLAQTDQFTGVYIYYAKDDPDNPDPPFALITDGLSEVTGETSDDPDLGMKYVYHLLRTTQPLTSIRIDSRLAPDAQYDIDLASRAITRAE